jgi:hypothetical protein
MSDVNYEKVKQCMDLAEKFGRIEERAQCCGDICKYCVQAKPWRDEGGRWLHYRATPCSAKDIYERVYQATQTIETPPPTLDR